MKSPTFVIVLNQTGFHLGESMLGYLKMNLPLELALGIRQAAVTVLLHCI